MLDSFVPSLRYASRALTRRLGFASTVILTLALAIGASTAMFTVVHAVLLRPLPYQAPERLIVVWEGSRVAETQREWASSLDFLDWQSQSRSFEALAAHRGLDANVTGVEGRPERVSGGQVSAGFFPLLGVTPELGRVFVPEDDRPGGEPVVVLSHGFWQQHFGGRPDVLGKSLSLDEIPYRVVGVLAASFVSPVGGIKEKCWTPLQLDPAKSSRGVHDLFVLGKLQPGTGVDAAQSEMTALMSRLEKQYPEDNAGRFSFVEPLQKADTNEVRASLWVLTAAVGLVLLIGCANVSNLLLAKALQRQRELAVWAALGARMRHVIAQLLAEVVVLTSLGGALGVLLAYWAVPVLVRMEPGDLPRPESIQVDGRALLFALGVSLFCVLFCSLLPALQAARRDLQGALRTGSRTVGRPARLRQLLVVSEVALTMSLVIAAGLLIKSFYRLQQVELGFQPEKVVTLDVQLPPSRYPHPGWTNYPKWPEVDAFYRQLTEKARAIPGVQAVSVSSNHPLSAGWTSRIAFDDRPAPAVGEEEEVRIRPSSPDYFRATGTRVLQGRPFTEQDGPGTPPVVIVNQALARKYFAGNALHKRVILFRAPREIVGVVEDVRFMGLGEDVPPAAYFPFQQGPMDKFSVVVRTTGAPETAIRPLQEAIWSIDPTLAIFNVSTMEDLLSESVAKPRFDMVLLLIFAGMALLLSMVGVYGVMAHSVAQRTPEIGLRMALGGARRDILRLVFHEGMTLLIAGSLLGVAVALVTSRAVSSMLFQMSALDPVIFVIAAFALILIGMLACFVPSYRASRVDPLVSLQQE